MEHVARPSDASRTAVEGFFGEHLEASTIELFEILHGKIPLVCAQAESGWRSSFVATLGFSGGGLCGVLAIAMPAQEAPPLLRPITAESTDDTLCDALGELANMLLGRLKQRLIPHGIRVSLATPSAARKPGGLGCLGADEAIFRSFDSPLGRLALRIDLVVAPTFVWAEEAGESVSVKDGELLLL